MKRRAVGVAPNAVPRDSPHGLYHNCRARAADAVRRDRRAAQVVAQQPVQRPYDTHRNAPAAEENCILIALARLSYPSLSHSGWTQIPLCGYPGLLTHAIPPCDQFMRKSVLWRYSYLLSHASAPRNPQWPDR